MHLVGFIKRIYHNARYCECQVQYLVMNLMHIQPGIVVPMCMIWSSHSAVAEFPALMGCDAALLDKSFRILRSIIEPSSSVSSSDQCPAFTVPVNAPQPSLCDRSVMVCCRMFAWDHLRLQHLRLWIWMRPNWLFPSCLAHPPLLCLSLIRRTALHLLVHQTLTAYI